MVWTDEDTKDVMKKTLGTLLAAAMIAVVSKVYNLLTLQMTATLVVLIAVVFIALVLVRLRASTGERSAAHGTGAERENGRLAQPTVDASPDDPSGDVAPSEPRPAPHQDDHKVRKKAAKDELKRAKKEAKR